MKRIVIAIFIICGLTACHESLEDRSVREAKEYTKKFCPTPAVNEIRTDSVSFVKATKTYTYYCAYVGKPENEKFFEENKAKLQEMMVKEIVDNTSVKKLKEAGFNFSYIVYPANQRNKVLYQQIITEKEYR